MLLSIAADERAALHFDDLASALDAGLPVTALGGEAAAGERVVHGVLQRRGVRLSKTEDTVLAAGWRAGRVGAALRNRAEERRQRAATARQIWAGLRYPVLLLVLLFFASIVVGSVLGSYALPIAVAGTFVVLGIAAACLRRGLRSGSETWLMIPWVGRIAQDLGELPYLETLHSLYGAGVPLIQAHATAVASVPIGTVRQRLRIADRLLAEGRSLTDSLRDSLALHGETRTLLATGEQAGQLEEALHKALVRRRTVAARSVADTARWAGIAAYAIAVVFVLFYVTTVFGSIYSIGR